MSTRTAALIACAIAIALAAGPAVSNGFVYDDVVAIVQNPHITDPAQWHQIPTSTYWLGTLWRPLTVAGFAGEWAVFRGAPWGFHLVSLLGYLAVAVLLFDLMTRLRIPEGLAIGVCVLFVVHPVHVEVIANVVGQSELWVAIALLGSTLLYLRARSHPGRRLNVWLILAVVALGITAKEQGFVAPLILLGAELLLVPAANDQFTDRARILLPVTALAVLLFVVRSNITGSMGGETPAASLVGTGFHTRALIFLDVVPRYAALFVWPLHLQADYNPPEIPIGGAITAVHLIGALVVVGFLALFWWSRRRSPAMAFGCWWTAVTLAPVSNLATPTGIVMAERVFFLPSIGLVIALAGGLEMLRAAAAPRGLRPLVAAVLVIWGVAATVRSAVRVPVWHDEAEFFTRMPLDAPRSYRAWKVAAAYWAELGRNADAEREFRTALALWRGDPDEYERLGQLLRTEGRCPEAVPVFTAGVGVDPERTTLRAKLVECLISTHRWADAKQVSEAGIALGQSSFKMAEARIARLKGAAADSSRQ